MTFEDAVEFILQVEGGYSNDKDDSGGKTKYGISKRSFPNLDIKNLTKDDAKNIYRELWNKIHGDELPDCINLMIFDAFVNMGYRGIMILQEVVGAKTDGIVGKETLSKTQKYIEKYGCRYLLNEYTLKRLETYAGFKMWWKYGLGWTNRTLRCWKLCIDKIYKEEMIVDGEENEA